MLSLTRLVKRGDLIRVRKALAAGSSVSDKDVQGWTPLAHAAHRGDLQMMQLLLNSGANVNDGYESGLTALFEAVISGHVRAVRELLRRGALDSPIDGRPLRDWAPNQEIRQLFEHLDPYQDQRPK